MSRLLGDRLRLVRAAVRGDVPRVDDRVEIAIAETAFLKASAIMYLGPLVGMLIGALGVRMLVGAGDSWAILGAAAGFIAGLMHARRFGSRRASETGFQPVILGRVPDDDAHGSSPCLNRRSLA